MTGRALPLTLTLSPEGRGDGVALGRDASALTRRLPSPMHPSHLRFPLPRGERVRVRGRHMRQAEWQTGFARDLRQSMTEAERRIWFALRDRRLCGLKFRRQVPLGRYIADFYCAEAKLILELDGGQHSPVRDAARDLWLQAQGFRLIHLWNTDVLGNLPGVLQRITDEARR